MKRILTSAFSISLLLCCSNYSNSTKKETSQTQVAKSDSTEKVALKHLFQRISNLPNASFKDDEILIGKSSIRLKVQVETEEQQTGKWIYAANIITFYKNTSETQIHVGSIGIGSNRDEAINVCIEEWFAQFALPFTDMLNGEKSIRVSNMKVFSGLMGIRGKLPEKGWPKKEEELTNIIISQIQPLIKSNTSNIIPIDIKLMIGNNGITDGECRINNEVSTEALNNLKQLSWPASEEGYLYKQFYLIETTNPK